MHASSTLASCCRSTSSTAPASASNAVGGHLAWLSGWRGRWWMMDVGGGYLDTVFAADFAGGALAVAAAAVALPV